MNDGEIELRVWPATAEMAEELRMDLGDRAVVRLDTVQRYSKGGGEHLALFIGGATVIAQLLIPFLKSRFKSRTTRCKARWKENGVETSVTAEIADELIDAISKLRPPPVASREKPKGE